MNLFKIERPTRRNNPLWFLAMLLLGFPGVMLLLSFVVADADKISGKVYRDFNANGQYQNTTTYQETGVAGVTVKAYNAAGTNVGTATTDASGDYTLSGLTAVTKYRIEFTGLQTGDYNGAYGTGSGTSVQFVSSGTDNVNLGVNYPQQYSSTTNPKAVTSGYINGDQDGSDYNVATLWGVPFTGTHQPTVNNLGTAQNLGSVWGLSYAKKSKVLYAASFTKRYVGFGPSGPGAIYSVQLSGDLTGGTPGVLYDFPDASVGPLSGAASAIHGVLATAPGSTAYDNLGFDNVGKTSLGDIAISDDEQDLYVVNLYDRTLNKIKIATKVKEWTKAIPSPFTAPYAADSRPFALKFYRGKIYVGVVKSNESSYLHSTYQTGGTAAAYEADKGQTDGMNAVVYEFDGTNFAKVLDFPLTFKKQPSNADKFPASEVSRAQRWRPWTATYREDRGEGENFVSYPQAWLTDIEFDVNGEMILAIRDRCGDQMGYANRRPSSPVGPGGSDDLKSAISPGQVYRASKRLPGDATAGWEIENKGAVKTGGTFASPVSSTRSTDQKKQFGPGGTGANYTPSSTATEIVSDSYFNNIASGNVEGKYYWGDIVAKGYNHGSSSSGGLALLAGSGKVIMTAMDPTDVFNTGGLKRLINSDGILNSNGVAGTAGAADDNTNNVKITGDDDNDNGTGTINNVNGRKKGMILFSEGVTAWGKASGMGDVELITAPAPIEIGNRIWNDKDADGVQDADEIGIANVSIQLLGSDGTTVIATAITDSEGRYIFSSATGTSSDSFRYGLTALVPDGTFTLRILNTSGASRQTALATYTLTGKDKDPGTNGDERDSDGTASGNNTTAAVTTGDSGNNNHSFDFGFFQAVNLGNKVWIDANNNGIQDSGELAMIGATVNLYVDADNNGTADTPASPLLSTTTNGSGLYLFDNLVPGNYIVGVIPIVGGYISSTVNGGDPDAFPSDTDDNGITTTGTETFSNTVTLSLADEPTNENPSNNPANAIADNSSNLTVDFGFFLPVNVGNKVWLDANNDGILNNGELPISGATVKLYAPGDLTTVLATIVTGVNGLYLFDNLIPGDYVVGVTPPAGGYVSSTVNAGDPDVDPDDNDDNGVTTTAGQTFSNTFTLARGTEPISESPDNNPAGAIADNSSNLTVDFGFYLPVNLGNKVWLDKDKNGIINTLEVPITGAKVNLYLDANEDGNPDGALIATTNTNEFGLYLFNNLAPGKYLVGVVNPINMESSPVNGGDPDSDPDDNDDNGVKTENGITYSLPVTLVSGDEPTKESPDNNPANAIADNSSNLTVDFGFFDPSLPVKLINFDAKAGAEGIVKLNWKTSEEINSDFFEVQRSGNGKAWAVLGNVLSKGESRDQQTYTFDDVAPLNGENLYRLKMVDLDNSFGYSMIRSVTIEVANTLKLFPNPTTDKIVIESSNGVAVEDVKMYTMLGKLVHEVHAPKQGVVSVQHLSEGMYLLRITTADGTVETRKVIIGR